MDLFCRFFYDEIAWDPIFYWLWEHGERALEAIFASWKVALCGVTG